MSDPNTIATTHPTTGTVVRVTAWPRLDQSLGMLVYFIAVGLLICLPAIVWSVYSWATA